MTVAIPPTVNPLYAAVAEAAPPSAFSLLMKNRLSAICLAVVVVYVLLGLLACLPPTVTLFGHEVQTLAGKADIIRPQEYAPPSLQYFPSHVFGTDIQGRSVFYRTLAGTRTALLVAVFTSCLSLTIGIILGVVAGYFGGWVDEVVNWLVSTVSSVPWILLVLALSFVLKGLDINVAGLLGDGPVNIPQLVIIVLALGLTDWVGICRLIRGEVLKLRALDYVSAGTALGLSKPRILFRHILPNTLHLVIITFTLGAVGYVQAEVALTFLGIGISDKPSWGRMIDDAKLELLRGVWWQFAAATISIGILCLALSLLGDALRDVLDPRTRSRR